MSDWYEIETKKLLVDNNLFERELDINTFNFEDLECKRCNKKYTSNWAKEVRTTRYDKNKRAYGYSTICPHCGCPSDPTF